MKHFKIDFEALDAAQLIDFQSQISEIIQKKALQVQIEQRNNAAKTSCPSCGTIGEIQKWGKTKSGSQRFKCLSCNKTFCTTTGTPLYRLRFRAEWLRYIGMMNRHTSLRKLRDDYGFTHHIDTLLRWRHRFLAFLMPNGNTKLAGIIEADEKYFRTSFKGSKGWKRGKPPQARPARHCGGAFARGLGHEQVPVLTALDRSAAICQAQLPDIKWASFIVAMAPWVEKESLICSDGHGAYPVIAKQTGCDHLVAKKDDAKEAGVSIGRIDAYHRDVENLVNWQCMGVSTRHLMNYLAWARRIRQKKPFGGDLLAEMMAA